MGKIVKIVVLFLGISLFYSQNCVVQLKETDKFRIEKKGEGDKLLIIYNDSIKRIENCYDSVARAVAYAIEQPEDVAVNEITVRPTKQVF